MFMTMLQSFERTDPAFVWVVAWVVAALALGSVALFGVLVWLSARRKRIVRIKREEQLHRDARATLIRAHAQRGDRIRELRQSLNLRAGDIAHLSQEIEKRDAQILELRNAITERRQLAATLKDTLEDREREVDQLTASAARVEADISRHEGRLEREAVAAPPVAAASAAAGPRAIDPDLTQVRGHIQLLEGQLQYWQTQVGRLDAHLKDLEAPPDRAGGSPLSLVPDPDG